MTTKTDADQRRAAFEAWYRHHHGDRDVYVLDESGEYADKQVQGAFNAWQARAAIEADRKRRGEPVVWINEDELSENYPYDAMYPFSKVDGVRMFPVFWPETVLTPGYLEGHRDGLEWAARVAEANHPLTGDWIYDDPHDLAKALRKGPEMPASEPHTVETVRAPSDIELDDLADDFHGYAGNYTRHGYPIPKFNHVGYARALLARYGQPATDSAGYTLGPISDGGMDPRNANDRQARGEPSYWKITTNTDGVIFFECYHAALENYKREGWSIEPLYTAPQPQQPPEGYKLVPIEPTPEMLKSGWAENDVPLSVRWKAMLEAAPQPTNQGE